MNNSETQATLGSRHRTKTKNIKNTTQKTKKMNTENSGINKVVRNGKDYWFLYYIHSLIHVIKSS
jgi:hypothetical protein